MNILLPGQYPRSEHLIAATRAFDRHKISLQDLEAAQEQDVKNFYRLQQNVPYLATGLFAWQDLMRPLPAILSDTNTGSLMRFFETNTFWRQLEGTSNTSVIEEKIDQWISDYFLCPDIFPDDTPIIFNLPFLYLFDSFSQGFSLPQISIILEKIALRLLDLPNKMLCFHEPTLGWKVLSQEERDLGTALLRSIKAQTAAPLLLRSTTYNIESELPYLYSLPLDGIGIDFYANPFDVCMSTFPKDKLLLAGIINTDSTLIEAVAPVNGFLNKLQQYLPPEQIYITPSGLAELLPREIMDQKVNHFQEIIAWLK